MYVTEDILGLLKNVETEIERPSFGEVILLLDHSFLVGWAAGAIRVNKRDRNWLSGIIPKLWLWKKPRWKPKPHIPKRDSTHHFHTIGGDRHSEDTTSEYPTMVDHSPLNFIAFFRMSMTTKTRLSKLSNQDLILACSLRLLFCLEIWRRMWLIFLLSEYGHLLLTVELTSQ